MNTVRKSIEYRKNNSAEKRKKIGNNNYNQRLSMEEREIKPPLKEENSNKNVKKETKETPTTAKSKTNSVEKKKGTAGFNLGGIFKKKNKK